MPTELVDKRFVDPSLTFSHPRSPKVSAPSIDVKLAEANDAGQRAAAAAAEQAEAQRAALHLSTRIGELRTKLTELQNHLSGVEQRDLKAQLEVCRATFRKLFGKPNLSHSEVFNLNEAGHGLAWIPQAILEVPVIKKDLKTEIAEVEKDWPVSPPQPKRNEFPTWLPGHRAGRENPASHFYG